MNWIKCSDRLPDDGVWVLGYAQGETPETVCYYERGDCFQNGSQWVENITHWMPLPEPPNDV